ncbi:MULTISPECIES: WD40/YVTN/BNR-like repeat-containing protein [Rhodanobacter]|uniref:WD40/YVTN/BNR-like repeat-containing protein n=1 Tax=Rhodanobacter TaxID=75309 RepID=UPI0005693A06|nr:MULTISPECIES: YCF48-related protein [Rhodanobacter]UJJ56602.1 YCF48-related protein [Rhodanobacter thiooxydans]
MARLWSVLARLSPWLLIAALGYAAVFVQIDVKTTSMAQPLIEQRDQFLGGVDDGQHYWFVGQDGALLTMDQKTGSWQRTLLEPRENLQAIAASDAGTLVVVGNDGRLWVRENGEEWTTQELPLGNVARKLIDAAFLDGNFWVVGEMGAVFRGSADGKSWTRMRAPEDIVLNRIRSGPGHSLWITAEAGRLLRSDDEGATWELIELDGESLQSIAFAGDVGVIVGNRGHIYRSGNAGHDWTLLPELTTDHFYDVVAKQDGWIAVGEQGTVFSAYRDALKWQRVHADNLSRRYYMRVLPARQKSVLVGHEIGQLVSLNEYRAWPAEGQQ